MRQDGDDGDGVDGAKIDYVVMDDREACGLMGHGGRARLTVLVERATRVPARIWAAGNRGKQSEQTA